MEKSLNVRNTRGEIQMTGGSLWKKYVSFQHTAYAVSAFAGAFQYGGCGGCRQIFEC